MSRFKGRNNTPNGVGSAVLSLGTLLQTRGTDLITPEIGKSLLSVEGISEMDQSNLEHQYDEIQEALKADLNESFGAEGISEVGLEAATIIMMASHNLPAYAQAATSVNAISAEGIEVITPSVSGIAGNIDVRSHMALEAFDDRSLRSFVPHSIVFNALAASQDEFGEAFYPTYVLSPESTGLDVSLTRTLVFNEVRRSLSGNTTSFDKRNLIDALQDASILENQSTQIVPVFLADNSNASKFVPVTDIALRSVTVDGNDFNTSPLRIGASFDLIALSQGVGNVNGQVPDSTDSIDARITLEAVYLRVTSGAAIPVTSVIRVKTSGLPRSGFTKSVEGGSQELQLSFSNANILLDANTLSIANVPAPGMEALQAVTDVARMSLKLNGDLNTETGSTQIFASDATIVSMFGVDGVELDITAGAAKAIVDDMTFVVLGYELKAFKSNANRRTRGLLIDNAEIVERYTIPLGAPISAPAPLHGASDTNADLKALIATTRTRTSNNSVTTLLNYADMLKTTVNGNAVQPGEVSNVEGIARYVVKPFYEEITLDMVARVASIKSHEKAEDVSSILVNTIRDIAYRMVRDSNYSAALETQTLGSSEKPRLLIGTDNILSRHIMISGDDRTTGLGVDHKMVSSSDSRMNDKIVLTLSRANNGKPDPLSFGTHAFMPELTSTAQVSRGNTVTKETQVQPRDLHVNHLPVIAVINVVGLSAVLQNL